MSDASTPPAGDLEARAVALVRAAIAGHLRAEVDDLTLARALAEHPAWRLPLTEDRRVDLLRSADGALWMRVWTGGDRSGPWSVPIAGWELLPELDSDLGGLQIDPDTPEAIHYERDQLVRLRAAGRAAQIERLLRGALAVEDPWEMLREHPDFCVLGRGKGAQILLAPDDRGRRLAAVFTAWDAALRFLGASGEDVEGVEPLRLPGADLFRLLLGIELDGMVFNPAGPGAPIPASIALASQALESDG